MKIAKKISIAAVICTVASTAIVECSTLGRVIPFFSVIRCVFLVMCYLPNVNVVTGMQFDA